MYEKIFTEPYMKKVSKYIKDISSGGEKINCIFQYTVKKDANVQKLLQN